MSKVVEGSLWQDREIRFDIDDKLIKERSGEKTLGKFQILDESLVDFFIFLNISNNHISRIRPCRGYQG